MCVTRGRFAPSPTGRMHLGNAFTALMAWLSARSKCGEVVLRIEDLDPARSRPEYVEILLDDLRWLGLDWDSRAEDQSRRSDAYRTALDALAAKGLLYPCYCTRDQLHAASAPHASDGRIIYAGTCRNLAARPAGKPHCMRARVPERELRFTDGLQGPQSMDLAKEWGDFIVRRSDGVAAYQLAVVVDDAASGITEVVRGRDLLSSTPVQLWLYEVLGFKPPSFCHVPMLMSVNGHRLSKRERALGIGEIRKRHAPEEITGWLAWRCGLIDRREAISPRELATVFDWSRVKAEDIFIDEKEWI